MPRNGFSASKTFLLKIGAASAILFVGILMAILVGFVVAVALIPVYRSEILPAITIGVSAVVVILMYLWYVARLCLRTSALYGLPIPPSGLVFPMVNVWLVLAALRFKER